MLGDASVELSEQAELKAYLNGLRFSIAEAAKVTGAES
jgi:hypothetical protein